ncbi:MAG: TIR domain-containing protein, partial [Clostridia bacterium]|nr:TIR domain-containing protein [Clostridia bacterium]
MGYAFISYSSKNQSAADALRDLLNEKGIDTWMAPGDIPAGSSYMKEINHALKDCSCLVLLLSVAAQSSEWVIKEVERAVNYHKPVIPVQIEDVMLNDEFEFVLGSCQVVAVQKIDMDSDETKKILNSVSAATGVSRETPQEDTKGQSFYLESTEDKKRYRLKDGLNIIGRDLSKATVILDNNSVSNVHA